MVFFQNHLTDGIMWYNDFPKIFSDQVLGKNLTNMSVFKVAEYQVKISGK